MVKREGGGWTPMEVTSQAVWPPIAATTRVVSCGNRLRANKPLPGGSGESPEGSGESLEEKARRGNSAERYASPKNQATKKILLNDAPRSDAEDLKGASS